MRRAQQRLKERGHAVDEVRMLFLQQLGIALDGEGGHKNAARAADKGGVDADAETEAVEDRHDREHFQPLEAGIATGRKGLQRKGVEVIARKTDALCRSRRAAGVENAGTAVVVLVRGGQAGIDAVQRVRPEKIPAARQLWNFSPLRQRVAELFWCIQLIGDARDEQQRAALCTGDGLPDLAVEPVESQDRLAVRLVEVERDFLRGRQRMDHIGNRADAAERVKAVHSLRRVGHADRHAVALADAEGVERGGRAVDAAKKRGVADRLAHKFVGTELGHMPRRLCHKLVHRQLRIGNGRGHIAVKIAPGCVCREGHGRTSCL